MICLAKIAGTTLGRRVRTMLAQLRGYVWSKSTKQAVFVFAQNAHIGARP